MPEEQTGVRGIGVATERDDAAPGFLSRRWPLLAVAVVVLVVATVWFVGRSADDSSTSPATTEATGAGPTTSSAPPVVRPGEFISVVRCGAEPKVQIDNTTTERSTYLVIVRMKGDDGSSVVASGRSDPIEPGAKAELTLKPLGAVPDGATCTVAQSVRTKR